MIAIDRLAACALGDLAGDTELAVEEHVVSCGACAAIYEAMVRIGPAIAELVRAGAVVVPATPALIARLEVEGLVSRRYLLAPGATVPCTIGAGDVYALTTLEADLTGVARVDVVRGTRRYADVPFDRAAGRIHLLVASELLRSLPTGAIPVRAIAVEPGGERTLGEYTLDHTAPAR